MDLMLENKVVIVTGATGICKETALAFAKEGATVVTTYLSNEDELSARDSVNVIKSMGQKAMAIHLDLLNLGEIKTLVGEVLKRFKKIDVLVNCAGTCTTVLAENVNEEQWNNDIDINLKGLFFCCKEVFKKSMKKNKNGSIINISSVIGVNPAKTNPIYGVAKAGVIHISRYLAIEWGNYNIRINSISPGWVETKNMLDHQETDDSYDPDYVTRFTPLLRYGAVEEIANAIVFLASNRSSFTNGANIVIDGGLTSGIRLASLLKNKIVVT